jgi:L-fuconolactonase
VSGASPSGSGGGATGRPPHLDAHIHLWRRDDGSGFWMRSKIPALDRDFTEDDLRANRARCGVGGAIVVQALHELDESRRLLDAASASDQLPGVVAWCDLFDPALDEVLARYRAHPRFVGVRPLPPDTFGGDWIGDPRSRDAFRRFEALDVSVDVLVRVEDLPRARAFLRAYPGLRVVLNHGGRPAVMTGQLEPWATEIRAFARETAAVVKCSGLVERAGVEWSRASVRPYVETLVDAFGPARTMFATNWPVSTISSRYDLWVDTLAGLLDAAGLPDADRDAIMGGTAARHYRIDWPPRRPANDAAKTERSSQGG